MRRYVIMARENYPGANIKEVCRCNGSAIDIRNALYDYTVLGACGTPIHKYNHVEILDLAPRKKASAQMKKPMRNIHELSGKPDANQLLTVMLQIDAMRAANGEAAQGPAAESGKPLPIGQSEANKP